MGDSQQNIFRLQVISAYILFLDKIAVNVLQEPVAGTSATGMAHWKVRRSFFVAGLNLETFIGIRLCLAVGDIRHEHELQGQYGTTGHKGYFLVIFWVIQLLSVIIQVSVDGISLVLHLCADTLSTVTAFIGDLGSVASTPGAEQ